MCDFLEPREVFKNISRFPIIFIKKKGIPAFEAFLIVMHMLLIWTSLHLAHVVKIN